MDNTNNIRQNYITGSVTSKDGITIGYLQLGTGPGIILLHGGASASQSYSKLGAVRSDMIIALQAASELLSIHKVALDEPPLDIDDSIMSILFFILKFDREIVKGMVAEANATLLKDFGRFFLAGSIQPLLAIIPRFFLIGAFKRLMRSDAENIKDDDVPLQELSPTFHFDCQLVVEMKGKLETFKAVCADVLLLGGSTGSPFLTCPLDALDGVSPNVERVELVGLSHRVAFDGGTHERVAQELRPFLRQTP